MTLGQPEARTLVNLYQGRLELTWTNKPLRLLAHEDGRYEWVASSDYRVAEVRLLDDVASVGEVCPERARDNLLMRGDALNALRSLAHLPEFAREYLGKVKLAYLDPPFNTQQSFLLYDDALEHSVWLTMIRDRLLQIRELLAPDGTVWLHLDDSEVHRARCVLDEVFGPDWFIATVIWNKADTLRNDARRFSVSHDYLLVYGAPGWEARRLPRTTAMDGVYRNPDNDPRGPWLAGTLISPHYRTSGDFEVVTPGGAVHRAPTGTTWRVPRQTFDRLLSENRIWFGRDGRGTPQQKLFLADARDRVVDTIWDVKEVGGNRQSKAEIKKLFPDVAPFDTPKPERLLQRIIHVSTRPGDVVLDPFLGSGTTAAVAHKMGRRWVGVEWEARTVDTYARPRLAKVIRGEDPGGITADVGWSGGGGFRVLEVAPSMFEADKGLVFLAEWMANGKLAEGTAAQLGFEWEPDPPFAGRKGRTRLAVVDGVVNEAVVRLLVDALPERERVVVCGTGIDTDARAVLRELRPGSTLRKIPAALLDEYRATRQLRLALNETGGAPASEAGASTAEDSYGDG
ncbi:MAG: site-specific DNA-methyltransferase [Candidatus Limnocylindrales bacterium]